MVARSGRHRAPGCDWVSKRMKGNAGGEPLTWRGGRVAGCCRLVRGAWDSGGDVWSVIACMPVGSLWMWGVGL